MSSKLTKQSSIVNPFAKTVLTITVNDQLQTDLQSQLPPKETAKILLNLAVDLMMGYTEQLVDYHLKNRIEGVGLGHDNHQHEESQQNTGA